MNDDDELLRSFGLMSEAQYLALTGLSPATAKRHGSELVGPLRLRLHNRVVYRLEDVAEYFDDLYEERLNELFPNRPASPDLHAVRVAGELGT